MRTAGVSGLGEESVYENDRRRRMGRIDAESSVGGQRSMVRRPDMSTNPLTPIPLGSPHVAEPPMFPRFGFDDLDRERANKRTYSRRKIQCELFLIDRNTDTVLRCRTEDISDAGVYATAPIGYGLAVGQRYELRIACVNGSHAASAELIPSLGFATVTRLEIEVQRGDAHRVGFSMKFDVPQLIPV
jgi:hypothetical protein